MGILCQLFLEIRALRIILFLYYLINIREILRAISLRIIDYVYYYYLIIICEKQGFVIIISWLILEDLYDLTRLAYYLCCVTFHCILYVRVYIYIYIYIYIHIYI